LYGRLGDLRDLAEFPRGDEPPYVRTWKRHKIDEAPQEAYLQNQESHCPQCMTYNCQSHSEPYFIAHFGVVNTDYGSWTVWA
jgi:hypothetical protein